MNIKPILQKIEEDAKNAEQQILLDANEKVENLRTQAKKQYVKMQEDIVLKANKESEALEERMYRMAELETRKELLQSKRSLLAEVLKEAKQTVLNKEADELCKLITYQILEYATGDETIILGSENQNWYNDTFLSNINTALVNKGKKGELTLSSQTRPNVTGVVLSKNGTEVFCTIETVVEAVYNNLETEIANLLFEK